MNETDEIVTTEEPETTAIEPETTEQEPALVETATTDDTSPVAMQDELKRLASFAEASKKLAKEIAHEQEELASLSEKVKAKKRRIEAMFDELRELAARGSDPQSKIDFSEEEDPDWMSLPVSRLELSEKLLEKLAAHFLTVGDVVEWIGTDFRDNIPGIGEKAIEKIREAVDQAAGFSADTIRIAAASQSAETSAPVEDNRVERDPDEGEQLKSRIDEMLDSGDYLEMEATLRGIRDWIAEHDCYTAKQLIAVDNIENYEPVEEWR